MPKHAYPDFGFLAFCLPGGSYKNQLLYHILIPIFFRTKGKCHQVFSMDLARIQVFYNPEKTIRYPSIHGLVPLVLFSTFQTSSQWALSQCGHGQNGKLGTGAEQAPSSIFSICLELDFANTGFQCWLWIAVIHYVNKDFRILFPLLT